MTQYDFSNDQLLVVPNHDDIFLTMGCQLWYPAFSMLHCSLPHLWPEKWNQGWLRQHNFEWRKADVYETFQI